MTIDWFEASVKELSTLDLFDLLVRHLGFIFRRFGCETLRDDAKAFDARGAMNLRVRADRVGQANREGVVLPWAGVRLPGELCRAVGTDKVLDLAQAMGKAGALKVSRIDLALDDFDQTFSPRKFAETCVVGRLDDEAALLGPKVITRVRRSNWEWSRRVGGCFWLGKGGERLIRVYDKAKESKGLIPSTRVELQCRDDYATALTADLLKARSEGRAIAGVYFSHLVAFVDLREPVGSRSSSQTWPRVGWWHELVGDAVGVVIPGRADSEVGAWVSAMSRQCGGFLSVMLRAHGVDRRTFATASIDEVAAKKVVSAVRSILNGVFPDLTAEQQLRLEQLQRLHALRFAGLRGLVAGG